MIRRLHPADAAAFRDIRLEGLRLHPAAFGASYDDENAQPLDWFAARIADHAVFGAFSGAENLEGVAGLMVPAARKTRHKGVVWGMYVRESARGSGLAAALLGRVLEHAASVVEEVKLEVSPDNRAAMRLYEAAGFGVYAREPRALKIGDAYHDSLFMTLRLTRPDDAH